MPNELMPLMVKLDPVDVQNIQMALNKAQGLPAMSAQQMLAQLREHGINAPVFPALRAYIGYVEEPCQWTYDDGTQGSCKNPIPPIRGKVTIGIGLNLSAHPTAGTLFKVLNTTRDWHFDEMRTHLRLPQPPLNTIDPTEIDRLFVLTLTGVHNAKIGPSFTGLMEQLIHQLDLDGDNLSNMSLTVHQLIALQSLAFNVPTLVGKGLRSALKELTTKGPMNALIEIDEIYKNMEIGLAHRRLKDVAMFLGDTRVAIPYRQVMKLLEANLKRPLSNLPGYPLPFGDLHTGFRGNATVTVEPGRGDYHDNKIYYGSTGNDYLVHQGAEEAAPYY
jgi:hypothetical protein